MYLAGILTRLQTLFVAAMLFFCETSNICVVVDYGTRPILTENLPNDLSQLPGTFTVMNYTFNSMISMLFIFSVINTVMYFNKIFAVYKYYKRSKKEYDAHVKQPVLLFKIWNAIFFTSLICVSAVFMTNAGRVCAGWNVFFGDEPIEERENYLFARGMFIVL